MIDYLATPRKVRLMGRKRGKYPPLSAERRFTISMHERVRRWAIKYWPDTLRLL